MYLQLYLHIRSLIQDGVLQDGTKLPSIRALKQQLNISKTTIETAYHLLLEEGYAASKERSGLVVINPSHLLASNPAEMSASFTSEGCCTETRETDKKPLIDFSLLTVDGDSFPIRIWKSVAGEALSQNSPFIHQYGDPRGEYALRVSLAQYLQHSRGVVCTPEQVIVGNGISYSIQLLSKLLEGETSVGIEKAGIAQVREAFVQNGLHPIPISMQTRKQLEQECSVYNLRTLYVTPSHRPTGEPLPYGIRQEMLQWAADTRGYILEDDYDGELRLSGKPIPSLQGLDKKGVVIYMGTFSKVFTPAFRMNYMVLPPKLLNKMHTMDKMLSPPSRIDQWAMQLFISRGHWYRHLRRMRKVYRLKHHALVQLIKEVMPDSVQVEASGSGLHLELSISANCSAEELVELARNEGVLVYGSQDSSKSTCGGKAKVYAGFGGVTENEMKVGIHLLRKAWMPVLLK
ncbi:PLP-dependent aminotransferase family protein [Paenibacillus paridis]|uniref:MocR-like pyridoxine biosynthesis transcription factor PdxR n=1 Tax=Paenibacillus paridis TaxID=2583376 RepID=UPI00308311FD